MRFINTKRFSPVIYENDLPRKGDLYHIKAKLVPKTEARYKDFKKKNNIFIDTQWWNKQIHRCLNGYSVPMAVERGGDNFVDNVNVMWHDDDVYLSDYNFWIKDRTVHISGRHYFYLNFWKIKRLDKEIRRKRVMNPKFTDLSWENYLIRQLASEALLDNLWTKSRQKGLSEEEACEIAYDFIFHKESQSLIISGQDKYAKNTMNFVKRGLLNLKNTQFHKWTSHFNDDEIVSENTGSEIYKRVANDNTQAASALSPSRVLYEEIGIWKRGALTETSEFIKASQEAEGTSTSRSIYTGTGGEMDSGVDDMQEMFFNPDNFNLYSRRNRYTSDKTANKKTAIFIPAMKFELIDDDGNSLYQKSSEKIDEDRLKKRPSERFRAITQKPKNVEELFQANPNGYFGDQIISNCIKRKIYIQTHKEADVVQRGTFKWRTDIKHWQDGVIWEPDPNGVFYVSELPRTYYEVDSIGREREVVYKGLYKAGTDSYDQDEAKTSTSKGACVIKKGFLNANDTYNKYVAYVLERPSESQGGREVFFEYTALLCVAYMAENLIEHSKILIFSWYDNNGLSGMLKRRPTTVIANTIANSKMSNLYGIDAAFIPYGLKMQRDYFASLANIENMDFIVMLDATAKFKIAKDYNCDLTIAMLWCTVQMEDDSMALVEKREEIDNVVKKLIYRTVNGRLVAQLN